MNVVRCTADARSLVAFYQYKCIMHHADGENHCIALRLESNILDLLARAQKRKSIIANRFARYLERKRRDRTWQTFFFFFLSYTRAFLIETADFSCNTIEAIEILRHDFNGEKSAGRDWYIIRNVRVKDFAMQIEKFILSWHTW